MAEATLSAPLTLDPQQATKLRVVNTFVNHRQRTVRIEYEMVAANGTVVSTRTVSRGGAAVDTWITNQESTIYAQLLAQLGVTGTVA